MNDLNTNKQPDRQKKYRRKQQASGLVRFEIQVSKKTKQQFDLLVNEVANEFPELWDIRQRQTKAKTRVFDEITQSIRHEFYSLKDQITALRAEIRAISPSFFTSDEDAKTQLPEAIYALPDDSAKLKQILAKTYKESQTVKQKNIELVRKNDQLNKLYQVSETRCEDLEFTLEKNNIDLPPTPTVSFKKQKNN